MNLTPVPRAAALAAALALAGCATPQNRDPLEPMNRKIFGFNDAVDRAVLKPVARRYVEIVPQPVQTGVGNFINNIKDVWSAINLVLQGRPGEAAQEVLRVGLNSTLGVGGLIDIATPMALERHGEDFGQTLGVWGAPPGAYLVLPFLGPSTTRDVIGLPGDLYFSASRVFQEPRDANWVRAVQVVHTRAKALGATDLLGDVALDQYSFVRDAYLQRRQSLIYNGDVPYDDGDEDEDTAAPEPAALGGAPAPVQAPVPANPPAFAPAPAPAPAPAAPRASPAGPISSDTGSDTGNPKQGAALWQRPLLIPQGLAARAASPHALEPGLPDWFQASMAQLAGRQASLLAPSADAASAVPPKGVRSSELPRLEAINPSTDELAGLRETELPR